MASGPSTPLWLLQDPPGIPKEPKVPITLNRLVSAMCSRSVPHTVLLLTSTVMFGLVIHFIDPDESAGGLKE